MGLYEAETPIAGVLALHQATGAFVPVPGVGGVMFLDLADSAAHQLSVIKVKFADGSTQEFARQYKADVKTYGAKGDGVTDDTAAFIAADTAAGPTGTVLVPPGTYRYGGAGGGGPSGATGPLLTAKAYDIMQGAQFYVASGGAVNIQGQVLGPGVVAVGAPTGGNAPTGAVTVAVSRQTPRVNVPLAGVATNAGPINTKQLVGFASVNPLDYVQAGATYAVSVVANGGAVASASVAIRNVEDNVGVATLSIPGPVSSGALFASATGVSLPQGRRTYEVALFLAGASGPASTSYVGFAFDQRQQNS